LRDSLERLDDEALMVMARAVQFRTRRASQD